ncbi:LysR family transcriptional regulator [Sinirhodobacter populi]|uniref:LysR family transcriptional regulator n=1 Tax=Paenirhodobacter populi TaxID=2306993 RepID=A0A443K2E0_9RHOB|nr:LysR substrate-binding domain-containing protein [Sinirhodobacter populi]RWR26939.1 LysR family transcriptional regulator [Sinirhodobacter populi]
MDTRFLESFLTVADCGSIAEAARRLNVTPAAVAQRIRALEVELGQSLVTRVGRTVRPTAAGMAVRRHAPDLLRTLRDLRAIAADELPAGQLRIGATATALTGLIPGITASMSARFPQVEYFLKPGSSADLYHDCLAGELDAALIMQPQFSIPKGLDWATLRREALLLLAPQGMPIHDIHATICAQPFIRYDRDQWGGQIVDRYLRRHALKVREWAELDALDAIATLVDRGLGVALVPDWAPPWPEGLKLQRIRLEDGEIRHMGVLWGLSGSHIAAIRAFVETCQMLARPAGPASPR